MKARSLLPLLYASIFGILFILSLVVGFAFSAADPGPSGNTIGDAASVTVKAVPRTVKLGRAVWNANSCGACHNKNMKDDMTGPALKGVTDRWSAYPRKDLYAWVRSSQMLIAAKHPRALEVWKENDKRMMTNYPNLTDTELEGLLAYMEEEYN